MTTIVSFIDLTLKAVAAALGVFWTFYIYRVLKQRDIANANLRLAQINIEKSDLEIDRLQLETLSVEDKIKIAQLEREQLELNSRREVKIEINIDAKSYPEGAE